MGRKKRIRRSTVSGIQIERAGAEGKAIAHHDGKVVFVPFGAPGDTVTLEIKKSQRKYLEGKITAIEEASPMRQEPRCQHFGICGGCKWQHLPYKHQLEFKQQQVQDAIDRLAKVDRPELNPILGAPSEFHYRNKMEYTATDSKWLTPEQIESGEQIDRDGIGFHIPGRFDWVFHINECHLPHPTSNAIRDFVYHTAKENNIPFFNLRQQSDGIRTVMVRNTALGEWMVLLTIKNGTEEQLKILMEGLKTNFPEIASLNYSINNKANDSLYDLDIVTYHGKDYITERLDGLEFHIHPKSFFQTNSQQAQNLYQETKRMAKLTGNEVVYDLYSGTGTIACYLAADAKKVVGVESVPDAVENAKENAKHNSIANCDFVVGDMKDVFTEAFSTTYGAPDVIISDPPRAGMHADVVDVILKLQPKRVVYVSCNPATQARDLALLDAAYAVEEIQPVDMFPHTHHVENIVSLVLR